MELLARRRLGTADADTHWRSAATVRRRRTMETMARDGAAGDDVKPQKYRNVPCTFGGQSYRSKREMKRHQTLLILQRAGKIANLCREVVYVLAQGVKIGTARKLPPLRYIADFVYEINEPGRSMRVVEDSKGVRTPVYRLKRHLMATVHGIEVVET